MRSFLLPLADVRSDHASAWRELALRAVEPNPFFEPEFVLPAARQLGDSGLALLVVARSPRDWVACLPVRSASSWKRMPVPTLAGWRNLYCFLGTPLVAPGAPEEALERLVEGGIGLGGAGMLALEWVGGDGPVAEALAQITAARSRAPVVLKAFERAGLRRREDPTYFESTKRAHHLRELRRLGRRLSEQLGAEVELRDRSQEAAAVDEFVGLEAGGWKGRRGTAFASIPGHADLFRAICDRFRESGRLQLLALAAGDRTVAMKCNLLAGDGVFCFKIAHDESLARFSPGVQLEQRMVDVFHERMPQAWMDSCADADNEMINRLWPDRRSLMSYAIPASGVVGWASKRGVEAALRVRNMTRRAS
jgi:CelD/BcsL family acetyltransferase involved in cellulose biosynthesis